MREGGEARPSPISKIPLARPLGGARRDEKALQPLYRDHRANSLPLQQLHPKQHQSIQSLHPSAMYSDYQVLPVNLQA
jgi:hypothetical protein